METWGKLTLQALAFVVAYYAAITIMQAAVVATRCLWLVNDPLNVLGCG